ncbi:hypothetical protein [Falsiroseomonas stagni]|uniref:Uncharacterized protein n=1 Tax=Falsiroseomonas stagni DSM 19981 TaxID=1123062 RepID=A0A1I4DV00_9PROT|nr:hypothetical protein [Falsiroseomonas stagni]SFK95751.1 hypothetical protein SAMN02745775_11220 [Falsiroseomonas stagni DSM 19981]
MVVHFLTIDESLAQGRFIGPARLIHEAAQLLPELKRLLPYKDEWRNWIDLIEGHGAIIPMLRWRVPTNLLQSLWDRHDRNSPRGTPTDASVSRDLETLGKFHYAKSAWSWESTLADSLHPLDDPKDGIEKFIEIPSQAPWHPEIYAPAPIKRKDAENITYDHQNCIPLFRQWQALALAELALAGPRTLGGLRREELKNKWPSLVDGKDEWGNEANLSGFDKHLAALEALSWNAAYRQRALVLAKKAHPDLGLFQGLGRGKNQTGEFIIRGADRTALILAEELVAKEALHRYAVNEDALLAAANWLGWRARWKDESGHHKVARAYALLMREAIELNISLGRTLNDSLKRMDDGKGLVERYFPVWRDRVRSELHSWINGLAPDFLQFPAQCLPVFTGSHTVQFLDWLEAGGLFAAHMSVSAIEGFGRRADDDAEVGVAVHVSSLAAWVEHVCNEALGPNWTGGNALYVKLEGCWGKASCAPIKTAFTTYALPRAANFQDKVNAILAVTPSTQAEWIARDARLTWAIRNEGLHRGLFKFQRREMHDAACILLRTAMGIWLTTQIP